MGNTPQAVAALYASVRDARTAALESDAGAAPMGGTDPSPATLASSLAPPLPGREARTVIHEEVDEAENLFFTEDGRLFISAAEDIYEIERGADGSFTKTDHFEEDCLVEGIVQSGRYLYGVCWILTWDLGAQSFLLGGELTEDPDFRIIAALAEDTVANGMTVDPEGHVYVTYSTSTGEIARLTFDAPLQLGRTEIWTSGLPNVNGIKYLDGAMYVTLLNESLTAEFVRVPILPDGSAGSPEPLFERWLTVLDDVLPFESGFIVTDFLAGTLIFWDAARGVYAETPAGTFYSPTALAQGKPPMFDASQLIVAEKGTFLVRGETRGDLVSQYQLP